MPVDHPGVPPVEARRSTPRMLVVALSFLLTLAVLLVLGPFFQLGAHVS